MALPLLLPLLFTAGSMGLNTMAQRKQDAARADALAAERIRQRGFDREADAFNVSSQDQFVGAEEKQDTRASELADHFREVSEQPAAVEAPTAPGSGNIVVQNRNAAAAEEGRKFTDDRAEALGDFRSFGDLFGDFNRQIGRDASGIGTIGRFKRGSSGVLPLELEAANQKGSGMRTVADLFSLGSALTSGPALMQGGLGGMLPSLGGAGNRMASPPPRRPF